MNFVRMNDEVFHYLYAVGPEKAPLIVFLHSLGCDLRIWDHVAVGLKDTYSVLRYDLRGHGLSGLGTPPYSIKDHCKDLRNMIERFHIPETRLILCGLSIGGQIVMEYALSTYCKANGIMLCDTAAKIGSSKRYQERIQQIRTNGMEDFAGAQLERWFSKAYSEKYPEVVKGMYTMLTRQSIEGYIGSCIALKESDYNGLVRQIVVPAMCLTGSNDLSTTPQMVSGLAEQIPGALYYEVDGSGHLPCIETPESFLKAFHHFMEHIL